MSSSGSDPGSCPREDSDGNPGNCQVGARSQDCRGRDSAQHKDDPTDGTSRMQESHGCRPGQIPSQHGLGGQCGVDPASNSGLLGNGRFGNLRPTVSCVDLNGNRCSLETILNRSWRVLAGEKWIT